MAKDAERREIEALGEGRGTFAPVDALQLVDDEVEVVCHDFDEPATCLEEGSPAGVKAALEILGICSGRVRLPLVEASDSLKKKIGKMMKGI